MTGFNNQAFTTLVEDLLNDAFYLEARSFRGTISTIRQYAEVIVRKILDLSNEDYLTLGNKQILDKIKEKSNNNPLLLEALKEITNIGNKCTHTQSLERVTAEEVEKTIEHLFNLYAYLFIDYFNKYRFGINEDIQSSFSILPPIIRYIVLSEIYDGDTENVSIIDKLSLATLKAYDETQAITWLEDRKYKLTNMTSVTTEAAQDLKDKIGESTANIIISQAPNMFDLCMKRVKIVAKTIQEKGRLYDDFESAIELYKEKGIVEGETDEISKFNNLMDFVYLGRKTRTNEKLDDKDSYILMDNLTFDINC
ncbi:hypothetical protein [Vibrio sp. 1S139]|uniref:hypothetical protein n=1 Tax=Vibrio sp. 1S139 TaxID=3230006 RepID=UPI00352E8252